MKQRVKDELISVGMGIAMLTVMGIMESGWGLLWGALIYAAIVSPFTPAPERLDG